MSRLRFHISMSLDGYVAGPDATVSNPLGIGGERLHEWVVGLAAWREAHGLEGGAVNESTAVVRQLTDGIGAVIMGRNMFGGAPGPWDAANPWTGWWGDEPPFHSAVFVLTHHPRPPLALTGTTFHFVPDGIASALAQARRAAAGRDVALGGGANVAQQYLAAGMLDEMELHIVPTLLGGGVRLFDGVGDDLHGLVLDRTVATPDVTHVRFRRT